MGEGPREGTKRKREKRRKGRNGLLGNEIDCSGWKLGFNPG